MIKQLVNDIMTIYLQNGYYLIKQYKGVMCDIDEHEVKITVYGEFIAIAYNDNGKKQIIMMGRNKDGIQTNEKTE